MTTSLWNVLTPAQRRYLIVDNGVGAFICNFVINAAIAWFMFRDLSRVPFWGDRSVAVDAMFTNFLLPFITALIVTPLARAQIRAGRIQRLQGVAGWNWFPKNSILRGLLFGALAFAVLTPVTFVVLRVWDLPSLTFPHFVFVKAGFAAAEGALVTPFIALVVLVEGAGKIAAANPTVEAAGRSK